MGDDSAHDLSGASGHYANSTLNFDTMALQPTDASALMQNYHSPYLSLGDVDPNVLSQPDFLFPSSASRPRSFFQRASYSTGAGYLSGLLLGGVFGVFEGLRNPAAVTNRIKVNTILNAVGKRGPFLGNTIATLSVMYHGVNYAAVQIRGGTDDHVNELASGLVTGAVFRAASGPRKALVGALTGIGMVITYYVGRKVLLNEDIPISLPSMNDELKESESVEVSVREDSEEL
eukprot:m.6349 g.6349  ORF g.6349 m.6349 type:complete len:232 (+) comp2582_c0_seq1:150-845(+)